jgi:hypothetical protein
MKVGHAKASALFLRMSWVVNNIRMFSQNIRYLAVNYVRIGC